MITNEVLVAYTIFPFIIRIDSNVIWFAAQRRLPLYDITHNIMLSCYGYAATSREVTIVRNRAFIENLFLRC